jgi:hypothetical protein
MIAGSCAAILIVLKDGLESSKVELFAIPFWATLFLAPLQALSAFLCFQNSDRNKASLDWPLWAQMIYVAFIFTILPVAGSMAYWDQWSGYQGLSGKLSFFILFLTPFPSAWWTVWQRRRERNPELPFWPQYSLGGLVLIVLYLGGVMGVLFAV